MFIGSFPCPSLNAILRHVLELISSSRLTSMGSFPCSSLNAILRHVLELNPVSLLQELLRQADKHGKLPVQMRESVESQNAMLRRRQSLPQVTFLFNFFYMSTLLLMRIIIEWAPERIHKGGQDKKFIFLLCSDKRIFVAFQFRIKHLFIWIRTTLTVTYVKNITYSLQI